MDSNNKIQEIENYKLNENLDNQSNDDNFSESDSDNESSISDYEEDDEEINDEKIVNEYRNLDDSIYGKIIENENIKRFNIAEIYNKVGGSNLNKNDINNEDINSEDEKDINSYNEEDMNSEDEKDINSEDEKDMNSEDEEDNNNDEVYESENEDKKELKVMKENDEYFEEKDTVLLKTKNYINLPNEFERIQNRLSIYQNTLIEKMEIMFERISNIENRLTKLEQNTRSNYIEFDGEIVSIKELKLERLEIDEDIVLKALVYKNYQSVITIMRHYYRSGKGNKMFYPIRMRSKRNFEYFFNNQWLSDSYGHYITKVICTNIQNLFLKYNNFSNKRIKDEDFYLNQQFILKLSEDKYKKEIFKHIVDEIMTTTFMYAPTCAVSF